MRKNHVKVIGGEVVPRHVLFDLRTRDDSGSRFKLIVHKVGKQDSEIAACYVFHSRITFVSEDFRF